MARFLCICRARPSQRETRATARTHPDAASKFQTEPSASIVARFGFRSEPAVSAIGSESGMDADQVHDRLGPTVSAIFAPRAPNGFGDPSVESRAVWCSVSAFSFAPIRITATDSHIQVIKPMTAPSEP